MKPLGQWLTKTKPSKVYDLPLEAICSNPYLPRKDFNEVGLEELARSITSHGMIQPITVRKTEAGYQIITGERRLRACRMAGKTTIPSIIRDMNDREMAVISLSEDLQRRNLDYFEEAEAYRLLTKDFGMTQEEVAQSIGCRQITIANKMRLLGLVMELRRLIVTEMVTERHARALLKLNSVQTQKEVLLAIYEKDLTAKETEEIVENLRHNNLPPDHNCAGGRQQVSGVIKDGRIFFNTIKEIVNRARKTGIEMSMVENLSNDEYELIITVPKQKRQAPIVAKG